MKQMNASQIIAWLVCLLLAFCAAVLAVHNTAKLAVLEKRFAEVTQAAERQNQALEEVRDVLLLIEADLSGKPAGPTEK